MKVGFLDIIGVPKVLKLYFNLLFVLIMMFFIVFLLIKYT
jgi:hypothetical protein